VGVLVTQLVSCASEAGVLVKSSDLGNAWPLTVAEGRLECRGVNEVVFTANSVTYALNGQALGSKKYAPVNSIWLADPDIEGNKKNIGALIDRGLSLCK